LGFKLLREMLVTYPWDFSDPTLLQSGETFREDPLCDRISKSFNEQNLFFPGALRERPMISKFPFITKGVDLFRAQSIVEKQIQSDQGALWKRQNVMNFEAQAPWITAKAFFPSFGKERHPSPNSLYI
jgi:hypothetical protein